jgi:hypothetical protein
MLINNQQQKSNDPRDLEGPQLGAGLNAQAEFQAYHATGPYIPTQDIINSLEKPAVSSLILPAGIP